MEKVIFELEKVKFSQSWMFYLILALQNTDDDKCCAANSLLSVFSVPRTWSTMLSWGRNCLRNLYFLFWLALVSHSPTFLLYLSKSVQPKRMISKRKLMASQPACSFLIYGGLSPKFQCSLSLFGKRYIISTCRWRNRDKVSNMSWRHNEPTWVGKILLYSSTTLLHSTVLPFLKAVTQKGLFLCRGLQLGQVKHEHHQAQSQGEMKEAHHLSETTCQQKGTTARTQSLINHVQSCWSCCWHRCHRSRFNRLGSS